MADENQRKKKILVIDDDPDISEMLGMLLETRGYEVVIASSGKEAFERVSVSVDLILLDLMLPDIDGFEICRRIKEQQTTHHIPIIILSAKLLSKDIVEALYMGADDYLTKPFEYEELVARMEAVMRRGSIFNANVQNEKAQQDLIRELRRIIDTESVVPFFQPIYHLEPFKLLGFEALCRPKTDSLLINPELLFKTALQFGLYSDLEHLSWKKALEYASKHLRDEKIFLNCNPYLVEGPKFLEIKALFDKSQVNIKNVVLEITERSAISNSELFYENLSQYRDHGFSFAIDDVGKGYSSLEVMVETKPEVVKIDRHIITDIHLDSFKRSIVKFIVSFCRDSGILSIAEGIESKKELDVIKDLGVNAGQGYFLFKPTPYIDREAMCYTTTKLQ